MHLLYLDDSGSSKIAADTYVVLAGVSVFERRPHYLSLELERIAEKVWPDAPSSIELRGVDIMSGRRHWRGVDKAVRVQALKDALGLIAHRRGSEQRLWGVRSTRR